MLSTAPIVLPAPPTTGYLRFSADEVEFYKSTAAADATMLQLRGHVVLEESTWTVRAGDLLVNLDSRTALVRSGLEMDDGSSVIYGESGTFDLENNEGLMRGAKAGYPPWRIRASEAEFFSDRRVVFRSASFTNCDEERPHYHFRASSVRMRPGKYLFAWNPVFYAGRAPLFYSPFLWKSLRKKHLLHTRVSPGYDRRNGAFARTTTLYSFAPWMYGKLYLDYYGAQGTAIGTELQHHASEDSRGVLYAYRIREDHSGKERWTVLGSEYATLGSSYAFQGRMQAQSDAEFNNHYQRSNAFRVTPELVNGAAFVRRTDATTTRISYSRRDAQEPLTSRFIRQDESMPRIEMQTAPLAVKGIPWLATINLFADNNYALSRGFLQRSLGARAETTRTLHIVRGLSLTPRFALSETYESRRDAATTLSSTRTYYDAYTGRYELGGVLRLNSPVGYWDAEYARTKRTKPGTLQGDAGAPDYGVEKDLLSLQHTILPGSGLVVRSGGGYDFRETRGQPLGFRYRVQPFFADFNWSAGRGWQVSVRDEYALEGGNRAFLAQADWGDRLSDFVGFGVVNTADRPGVLLAGMEGGWAPSSSTWRFTGALRYDLHSSGGVALDDVRAFEKEITVVKDFHDFQGRALFRVRPGGVKEVAVRVEMRGGRDTARKIIKKGWESEWFPWRKRQPEDSE